MRKPRTISPVAKFLFGNEAEVRWKYVHCTKQVFIDICVRWGDTDFFQMLERLDLLNENLINNSIVKGPGGDFYFTRSQTLYAPPALSVVTAAAGGSNQDTER